MSDERPTHPLSMRTAQALGTRKPGSPMDRMAPPTSGARGDLPAPPAPPPDESIPVGRRTQAHRDAAMGELFSALGSVMGNRIGVQKTTRALNMLVDPDLNEWLIRQADVLADQEGGFFTKTDVIRRAVQYREEQFRPEHYLGAAHKSAERRKILGGDCKAFLRVESEIAEGLNALALRVARSTKTKASYTGLGAGLLYLYAAINRSDENPFELDVARPARKSRR